MASAPPPAVPSLAAGPISQNKVAQSKRALETNDKKNQKKFHGFIAGVTSGVTKLAVGHPFGMQEMLFEKGGYDSLSLSVCFDYFTHPYHTSSQ